jgi:hypothetical protein
VEASIANDGIPIGQLAPPVTPVAAWAGNEEDWSADFGLKIRRT